METTKVNRGRPSRETEVKIWMWMERNKETLAGLTPAQVSHACKADTGLEMHPVTARKLSKSIGISLKTRQPRGQAKAAGKPDSVSVLSDIVLRIAKELGVPVSDAEAAALKP